MKAKGNGTPQVCVNNLLRLFRGEVPYERVKGLDPRLIDRPAGVASGLLQQDADWLIETSEPRATIKALSVTPSDGINGGYTVTAEIEERGG